MRIGGPERDETGVDFEVEGVEDEARGGLDDVEVDVDGTGEDAGGEVGLEGQVVASRDGELGEAGLALEGEDDRRCHDASDIVKCGVGEWRNGIAHINLWKML